jgi:copper transport protein
VTRAAARSWWRWTARFAAAAAAAVLATFLLAWPASAHATLVSTDPADGEVLPQTPDLVTLTFSEPVNLPADAAQLFDAQGEQLEASASGEDRDVLIDVPDQLAAGTYVVTWRVVSAGGHPDRKRGG